MRVWLVDDKAGSGAGNLEPLFCQLAERPGGVRLIGVSAFATDLPESMRKLAPDLVDLLVINERTWPEGEWTREILEQGIGMVVVSAAERTERFQALSEQYPIVFVPPAPSSESLWLALVSATAGRQRERRWKQQIGQLQQRLNDRVTIERAKGVLVQRLKISEEEAYKRLRMQSRRQRRQIRDIAQSLLDTQCLFGSETNGAPRCHNGSATPENAPSRTTNSGDG
jgi:AmiR/NasT family two-component response regulator